MKRVRRWRRCSRCYLSSGRKEGEGRKIAGSVLDISSSMQIMDDAVMFPMRGAGLFRFGGNITAMVLSVVVGGDDVSN